MNASVIGLRDRDEVVVVTTSFPIRGDGSEAAGSFVADLVAELSRTINVRVVAPGPKACREDWGEGIEVFRYASPAKPLSTLKPWLPGDLGWTVRVMRGGLDATRRAVTPKTTRLIALWGLPCGEWARRAAVARGLRYSVWMLGSDVWSLGRIPVLKQMLARVIREATAAYADGYQLATDAGRIAEKEVSFLPSTREVDSTNAVPTCAAAPCRLLFLGRWHLNKGVDLLLDVLDQLTEDDWTHIHSVEIQGGGPLDTLVRKRVDALRERNRPVVAGGFLGKREAELALTRATWLLVPSRIESIPVVFSDAMKFLRPVLATPVGDLPRLLTGSRCGEVCDAVTPTSFATSLRAVVRGQVEIDIGSIRIMAQRFSLPSVAWQLLQADRGEEINA